MIIVLNLHSGTKMSGWLRHCRLVAGACICYDCYKNAVPRKYRVFHIKPSSLHGLTYGKPSSRVVPAYNSAFKNIKGINLQQNFTLQSGQFIPLRN
jgi:hypothetical protein